jgi:hypothetical protein
MRSIEEAQLSVDLQTERNEQMGKLFTLPAAAVKREEGLDP